MLSLLCTFNLFLLGIHFVEFGFRHELNGPQRENLLSHDCIFEEFRLLHECVTDLSHVYIGFRLAGYSSLSRLFQWFFFFVGRLYLLLCLIGLFDSGWLNKCQILFDLLQDSGNGTWMHIAQASLLANLEPLGLLVQIYLLFGITWVVKLIHYVVQLEIYRCLPVKKSLVKKLLPIQVNRLVSTHDW